MKEWLKLKSSYINIILFIYFIWIRVNHTNPRVCNAGKHRTGFIFFSSSLSPNKFPEEKVCWFPSNSFSHWIIESLNWTTHPQSPQEWSNSTMKEHFLGLIWSDDDLSLQIAPNTQSPHIHTCLTSWITRIQECAMLANIGPVLFP